MCRGCVSNTTNIASDMNTPSTKKPRQYFALDFVFLNEKCRARQQHRPTKNAKIEAHSPPSDTFRPDRPRVPLPRLERLLHQTTTELRHTHAWARLRMRATAIAPAVISTPAATALASKKSTYV